MGKMVKRTHRRLCDVCDVGRVARKAGRRKEEESEEKEARAESGLKPLKDNGRYEIMYCEELISSNAW